MGIKDSCYLLNDDPGDIGHTWSTCQYCGVMMTQDKLHICYPLSFVVWGAWCSTCLRYHVGACVTSTDKIAVKAVTG